MSRPLGVAIVGCGGIAQMMHLPTLAERPDLFRIAALADVSPAVLDAVGDRYGVAVREKDPRAAAARPDVDAVAVFASGCHRELVLDLLKEGKPLFVEKPLAFSLPETEEIAAAVRASGAPFMMGYHKRFDPAYLRARDAVREMRDLRFVQVTVLHPDDGAYRTHHAVLPLPQAPWRGRRQAELRAQAEASATEGPSAGCVDQIVGPRAPLAHRVGAYILFESLIHDVDAVRGILGDPRKVVSASVWQGGMAQTSLSEFAGDVGVSMSWISVPGLKHYEETLRFVGDDRRVTLVFPSPYIRHAPTPLSIEKADGDGLVVESHTVSYEEAFRAELQAFRRHVVDGSAPSPSVEDALGDARWIHAIARAYAPAEG